MDLILPALGAWALVSVPSGFTLARFLGVRPLPLVPTTYAPVSGLPQPRRAADDNVLV